MLVGTDELADYLGIQDDPVILGPRIELAEALVAAYLRTSTLAQRELSARIRPVRNVAAVELPDGPVDSRRSILELHLNGSPVAEGLIRLPSHWSVGIEDGFQRGSLVEVDFLAGWTDGLDSVEGAIPELVRQAVIVTAADAHQRRDEAKVSERIGDYAYQMGNPGTSAPMSVPPRATTLLAQWRKP